ncbi:S8 family serine peptidase [Lentzea kentuckyensis]|uniref:S8 family serine peptidase n=1 Tax=Lentzea kentuckyensis TaxID=360086 RepID=UPI00130281DC|nr:S8 family serine peptidase [Lentzea kentuckyensis]
MTIYWPGTYADASEDEGRTGANPANEDTGLPFEVPDDVLRRHGARVLEPSTSAQSPVRASDRTPEVGPAERPTAYVSSVLLIPRDLLIERNADLDGLLAPVGMKLPTLTDRRDTLRRGEAAVPPEELASAVPVVLQPAERPVDIDAWTALQALRANKDIGDRISLNHLMFASGWVGDLGGVPGPIQGFMPPFGGAATSGYLDGPVSVELPAIDRSGTTTLGRPAVVAVLDTGIGENTWLGIPPLKTGLPVKDWKTGSYVEVDAEIQRAVKKAGRYVLEQGHPAEVIKHPKDEPLSRNPLVGTQAWCFGHGEFCAGIIAQIAPKATVLAVRVMGTDGVATEGAVVAALKGLVKRIDGTSETPPRMVDVVSLSMGYLFERPKEEEATSPLAVQIHELRKRGVLVVAAAGNSASSQRFFPASLSTIEDRLTTPPVVSVGALNPNGSKALFTNEGPSVTCYATGTNVISTFPQDANASRQPAVQVAAVNRQDLPQFRQSPDVDDHTHSPFGVWTGTSFAAPHVAAHLANAVHGMAPGTVTGKDEFDQAMKRARDAVTKVQEAAKPPDPAP